jgi:hypothetical protein
MRERGRRRAAPLHEDPAVSRAPRLLGVLVTAAAGVAALVACGDSGDGTVVAKAGHGTYDYACQAGGTVTSPAAVPVWGACTEPDCWRLVVRDNDGNTSEPCVSREEYDRTRLGAFWHGRTDH